MDLNQLLHRHQISLMSADAASCVEARLAHMGLAHRYAARIHDMQNASGATARLLSRRKPHRMAIPA